MRTLAKKMKLGNLKEVAAKINDFIYDIAYGYIDADTVLYICLDVENNILGAFEHDMTASGSGVICIRKIGRAYAVECKFGVYSGNGKVGYNDLKHWALYGLYKYTINLAGWDIQGLEAARMKKTIGEAYVSGAVSVRDMASSVNAGVGLVDIFA